jgi:hypothetical protein
MEAWDERDNVRPIPIEDESIVFVDDEGPRRRDPRHPRRPWMPLSIALAAIVIVIGSVSTFGALRFDDPAPAEPDSFSPSNQDDEGSTTTATVLPQRLEDLLPGITDRLTMIAVNDAGVWALLWDPSFREPKAVPLNQPSVSPDGVDMAAFDSSGRSVAVRSCPEVDFERRLAPDKQAIGCDVYIGTPTDIGTTPDIRGVSDFIWHASEVNRIAWIQLGDLGGSTIVTASVNPLSGNLRDVQPVFSVAGSPSLVQWDALGFVLAGSITTAYSPTGEVAWTVDGVATSGTATSIAVRYPDGWSMVSRVDGSPIDTLHPSRTSVFLATSDRADLVGRLTEFASSYSLTVTGGGMQAPRVLNLGSHYNPIGFSSEGRYFLLQNDVGNTISFVDWRTSAAGDVTVAKGYRIIGLDIG